jgi:hypothetical protein
MRLLLLATCLLAASQPTLAQDAVVPEPSWIESPQFFIASATPTGAQVVLEGGVVFRAPARWLLAGRLERDVTVLIGDQQHTFAATDVLPQLLFMPDGTRASAELAYCTPRNRGENATRSGLGGVLLGGSLWDSLARSMTDTQFCLRDSDGDGLLDTSLLLGEGENDFVRGPGIDPVAVISANEAEISAADEVRIKLTSVGRNHVELALEIIQQGHNLDFTTMRSGPHSASNLTRLRLTDALPMQIDMLGIRFQITAFDREANTATISWSEAPKVAHVTIPDNYSRSFTY